MAYTQILAGEVATVLNNVNDFIANSNKEDALEISYRYISLKKKNVAWSHEYEKLMLITIELGTEQNKQDYITDNLTSYRHVSQNQISSLEAVFSFYVNLLEEKLKEAKTHAVDFEHIIEEINNQDEPQMFYYNIMNSEKAQENELCKRIWRMIMVAYKSILDLTNRNSRLEGIYTNFARSILSKLAENKAYSDFRYFCTVLKQHQAVLIESSKGGSSGAVKELSNFDSNKKLYDLRLFQFGICKKMNFFQEGFEVLEDVNGLMSYCKYLGVSYIEYYSYLAEVFFSGGFYYFHALSLYQQFRYLKLQAKDKTSLSELATKLVLAILAVNCKSEEYFLSQTMTEKYQKLIGSRKTLNDLFSELDHWIPMFCSKETKELFQVFNGKTDIYEFAADIQKIFTSITAEYDQYSQKIKENCILVVLRLLSNFFCNISFEELNEFTSFMSFEEVKSIILLNKFDKSLNLYLDVLNKMVIFNNNGLKTSLILKRHDDYLDSLQQVASILSYKVNRKSEDNYNETEINDRLRHKTSAGRLEHHLHINKEKELIKEQKPFDDRKIIESFENIGEQRERIKRLRLNELVDQKILELKKEKVSKIVRANPEITILNKKLSTYTDAEINQIELDVLADYEKSIKDKRKKNEVKALKNHYLEFHFTQKKLYEIYADKIEKEAIEENKDMEKYAEDIKKTKQKKEEMKNMIEGAGKFIQKYKQNFEERQKEEYNQACVDFKQQITDQYRSIILEEAKKKYEDMIKTQENIDRSEANKKKMGRGAFGTTPTGTGTNTQTSSTTGFQRGVQFAKPEPVKSDVVLTRGTEQKKVDDKPKQVILERGKGVQDAPQSMRNMAPAPKTESGFQLSRAKPSEPSFQSVRNVNVNSDNFKNTKNTSETVKPPMPVMAQRGEGIKKEDEVKKTTETNKKSDFVKKDNNEFKMERKKP